MTVEILISLLSILLGMTIMWLIFIIRDNNHYRKAPIPERHEVGMQIFYTEESVFEKLKRNVMNLFSIPNYKILIAAIFAIGLSLGVYLGYEMMQEVNNTILKKQQQSHIGYIIEEYQNNNIIYKGGDFIEESDCA